MHAFGNRIGSYAAPWATGKPKRGSHDGAVLPILHLNGDKLANPTVASRSPRLTTLTCTSDPYATRSVGIGIEPWSASIRTVAIAEPLSDRGDLRLERLAVGQVDQIGGTASHEPCRVGRELIAGAKRMGADRSGSSCGECAGRQSLGHERPGAGAGVIESV